MNKPCQWIKLNNHMNVIPESVQEQISFRDHSLISLHKMMPLKTSSQQGTVRKKSRIYSNAFKPAAPFPLMKLETSLRLKRIYLAWQILAKINSLTMWTGLKVCTPVWANVPEDRSPRTPHDLCSEHMTKRPQWRGFQSLTWVRGGL